ncbi:hypothetical protein CGCF245_v011724 [Colletotrichum fructicola]|nr:hypothetical protein CGCF245_v011724 [Colletotrichum fructicola]
MRGSTLLSLAALLTGIIAITSTTVLTPVEQSPYYYLGCYPYTAETAIGAYDIPNIATGYNNGNPVDCQIGCDQQFHAPYVFMYGTYCYCQVREFEFDIHQPGGAPVDNSFCTTPCFVDPNAPCGTLSNTDAGRYVTVYGKYGPRASFSPRVSSTSSTRPSVTTLSSISTLASSSTLPIPQSRSLVPVPRPPYSYLGCYSFALYLSKARHFENLCLFYEPNQHSSGFEVVNVYIHHNSEVLNVLIHKNNCQHLTVFCEPITRSHVFQYLDVSLTWFIGHHKPIILRIVSYTQLQHNGFVGIAITDVSRYICRFSKSDIVRHYVGPVFKRFHLAGNHSPADQLFLDFNDDTDDGQYCSSTKRVDNLIECGVSARTHDTVQPELGSAYQLHHQSCGIFFWFWAWDHAWFYDKLYHRFCNDKFPRRFTINNPSYHRQHHLRHQHWRDFRVTDHGTRFISTSVT